MSGQHRDEVNPFFLGLTIAAIFTVVVLMLLVIVWVLA